MSVSTDAEKAKWLLERITATRWPSDSPVLVEVANLVQSGRMEEAARVATSQPQFLNVAVKQMALLMSTREENLSQPLSDFVAGFMGVARDESDARELLYGNFYYAADPSKLNGATVRSGFYNDLLSTNNHYVDLENNVEDVANALMRVNQQVIATSNSTTVVNPDPAGVLTSRAWFMAHVVNGTNRRPIEFAFREFMCVPIDGWADTNSPDIRIGRDIDRYPAGDHTTFATTCKGCHSVMDGFRGAYAKWDYRSQNNGYLQHMDSGATDGNYRPKSNNGVVYKMNRPDFIVYTGGFVSSDDSWVNHADRGQNSLLFGWRGMAPDNSPLAGRTTGVHALGRLIANSTRFSQCMAQRAFETVCRHGLNDYDEAVTYLALGQKFEQSGYNLKRLFEQVALHPGCKI